MSDWPHDRTVVTTQVAKRAAAEWGMVSNSKKKKSACKAAALSDAWWCGDGAACWGVANVPACSVLTSGCRL